MVKSPNLAIFAIALVGLTAPALTKQPTSEAKDRPELLNKLIGCRALTDAASRLACYDAQVTAIDAAEQKQDLVVMDRAQVRETRKSLFGFTLPSFSLGGRKLDKADEIEEVEGTVETLRKSASGWLLTVKGAPGTWQTGDMLGAPSIGNKVRIRKAAMGSYLGTVGFERGVRFRRVD